VQDLLIEHSETLLLFAILSALSLWMAKIFGYFKPSAVVSPHSPIISFSQVVGIFSIYLGTLLFIGTGIGKSLNLFLSSILSSNTLLSPFYLPLLSSLVQLLATLLVAYFIFLFCKVQKDRINLLLIWKDHATHCSIAKDIGIGMTSWVVSFPLVTLVGSIFDLLIYLVYGNQEYEQVAVQYLKMSLGSSILFGIAMFTVVIAAPFLEELLFRGFLLNFFKRYLGRTAAIVLSSLAFALFHFSLSQDLGNIPLVASLFTLALFLGYIYEKQRSLFASISLHMTFNAISVIRILSTS